MILYGRNLSPFTRRVAIWAALQGRSMERRQLNPMEDFEELKSLSPLGRPPILELDDGERLIESSAICDHLEDSASADARLVPSTGPDRRAAMRTIAIAHGVLEKGVSLVYEKNRRPAELHWSRWIERVEGQLRAGLAALEAASPADGFFGGAKPDGRDVVATVAFDFLRATNGYLLETGVDRLAALAARCDARPEFSDSVPTA